MDPRKRQALEELTKTPSPDSESETQMEGLGDVIAAATKLIGIEPCAPCERRRQWLNERVRFRK